MRIPIGKNYCLLLLLLLVNMAIWAHPTGNMVTVGKYVLWPYVDPVDDPAHHACLMLWHPNRSPEVLLRSEHPASDFMLYNRGETIYAIERRHIDCTQKFEIRILKFRIGERPDIIWDWFEDEWRIGEGGFVMPSDDEVIFGKYPGIYHLKKKKTPLEYFQFDSPIHRIRSVEGGRLLLLGDDHCWLVDFNGKMIKQWNNLVKKEVADAPLGRNQIFDADYHNGELLLAYWGNRSFVIVEEGIHKKTIVNQKKPFVPHWVAYYGKDKLLFSSELVFDGRNPKPRLMLYREKNIVEAIWTGN